MDISPQEKAQQAFEATKKARDRAAAEAELLAAKLEGDEVSQQLHREMTAKAIGMILENTHTPTESIQAQQARILGETNPLVIAHGYLSAQELLNPQPQKQPEPVIK